MNGYDGTYQPGCAEQEMTLWTYRGETPVSDIQGNTPGAGTAQWKLIRCTAMTERHASAERGADAGYPAECIMTGFLFPGTENVPASLLPGRDCLAVGRWEGRPDEAALAGAEVFRLCDVSRPARFSDGRLTDWCHFRAARAFAGTP